MELKHKAAVVELIGRRLADYMESGPYSFAGFILHQGEPDPLGIKGMHMIPASWFEDVKVPGFIVERVGRNGIRIW